MGNTTLLFRYPLFFPGWENGLLEVLREVDSNADSELDLRVGIFVMRLGLALTDNWALTVILPSKVVAAILGGICFCYAGAKSKNFCSLSQSIQDELIWLCT